MLRFHCHPSLAMRFPMSGDFWSRNVSVSSSWKRFWIIFINFRIFASKYSLRVKILEMTTLLLSDTILCGKAIVLLSRFSSDLSIFQLFVPQRMMIRSGVIVFASCVIHSCLAPCKSHLCVVKLCSQDFFLKLFERKVSWYSSIFSYWYWGVSICICIIHLYVQRE